MNPNQYFDPEQNNKSEQLNIFDNEDKENKAFNYCYDTPNGEHMDKSHFQNLNQSKQNFDENSEILYDLTGIQVLWLLYTK